MNKKKYLGFYLFIKNKRHRIHANLLKANSIHAVFEKLNNIIEELEYLSGSL